MNRSSRPLRGLGVRFGGRLRLLVLFAGLPMAALASDNAYALTEVLARSEPNAIMTAVDGWRGAYGTGKTQYVWSWFEAGVRGDHWGIGGLCRFDYDLRFSRDAAALYGAVRNDTPLATGRTYEVEVKAHVIHATGVRLSWRGSVTPELQTQFGLSVLKSNYMIEGSLQGTALATAPKAYTYTATVDYAYTKDVLFDRPVAPQAGYGFSMDASCDWRFRPDWRLEAQVHDLPGYLWWKSLPYTQAGATSDRTQTDSTGFTHWAPLISGTESDHRLFRQDLPARAELELTYAGWRVTPAIGLNYQFADWLPRLGLGGAVGTWTVQGWCWPTTRALGIELGRAPWKLGLSMDNLQWGLVKTVSFNISYNY